MFYYLCFETVFREEEDARVASEIAEKMEKEEAERRARLEQRDVALARHLQVINNKLGIPSVPEEYKV